MSPESKPKVVALIVASSLIMQQIDSTVITTALPQMAVSLHTDPVRLSVAVTAYLLSLAVFVPVSGWATDRFGGRLVFRAAIALFTLGSMLCGLSNNIVELTAARVLQGLGGAMMVPVGRLILFRTVEKAQLVAIMAYLQVPAQIGPVMGPPIGGFITTYLSWRWVFFINVPIGILGIVLVTIFFEDVREEGRRPLDWAGFLFCGTSLSCIMYGIEALGRGASETPLALGLMAGGVVLGWLSLRQFRNSPHPLLDISVFRIPTFRASIFGGAMFRLGAGCLVFLLPLLMQVAFGMTALASGLVTFASAAGSMTMKLSARPILNRFGFRTVLIVNGAISAATIAMCALFTHSMPALMIFALLLVAGFFQSLQYTATQTIAYADIDSGQMSTATSIASMAQQLSRGFGIALIAVLLHLSLSWRGASSFAMPDFQIAFVGAGLMSLVSLLFFLPLEPNAAAELSGRRKTAAKE
jgi:EmrB/QacA subfamily drug resistance transporter